MALHTGSIRRPINGEKSDIRDFQSVSVAIYNYYGPIRDAFTWILYPHKHYHNCNIEKFILKKLLIIYIP